MEKNGFRPQELNLSEIINRLESSPDFSFVLDANGDRSIRKNIESFHVEYKRFRYHEVHITSGLPREEAISKLRRLLGRATSYDGDWARDYALCYNYLSGNNGKERTYVVLELHKRNGA